MAKYHVNAKGETGICKAQNGGCPFGGESEHYATPEAAREAFEASNSSFAVVIKKTAQDGARREIRSHDAQLETAVQAAQQAFDAADDKADWMEDQVTGLSRAQAQVDKTAPGSPEREAALARRDEARTQLLAADLVSWKASPFYNESVEARMKNTAVVISDADSSLEKAITDERAQQELAGRLGIGERDVRRILELAQEEYQRPRAPRSRSLTELAQDDAYVSYTAHAFRIPADNVQEVISFAASRSQLASA